MPDLRRFVTPKAFLIMAVIVLIIIVLVYLWKTRYSAFYFAGDEDDYPKVIYGYFDGTSSLSVEEWSANFPWPFVALNSSNLQEYVDPAVASEFLEKQRATSPMERWGQDLPLIKSLMKTRGGIWINSDYQLKNSRELYVVYQKTWGENRPLRMFDMTLYNPYNAYSFDSTAIKNICSGNKAWIIIGKKLDKDNDENYVFDVTMKDQNVVCSPN